MLPAIIDAVTDSGLPPFVASELALAETLVRPFREQNQEAMDGFEMLLTVIRPTLDVLEIIYLWLRP